MTTTYPNSSGALLPYIIFNYTTIYEIDENKNIEEQLKKFKISHKEFMLYLVFYKRDFNYNEICNKIFNYSNCYIIGDTIVEMTNNYLS